MFFTLDKLERQIKQLHAAIYRDARDLPTWKMRTADVSGAERPEFDDRAWDNFRIPGTWGGYDIVAWFRTRLAIPREWREHKLAVRLLAGPLDGGESAAESLLYVNGTPLQGFDMWHEEAWLPPEVIAEGEVMLALRAWSGVLGVPERRRFQTAQLVWIDADAECFFYLADTLVRTVKVLDENDLRRIELLAALNDTIHLVHFRAPGSDDFYASLSDAFHYLDNRVAKLEQEERKPTVTAVGHAHLDMAWLWRIVHTREKAARTFATALHLMRQFPDYRFMHSSPQLYKYLQHDHPVIFARIKDRVAAGQWEITGGMWVEADTNITGAESLVRQILFGKRWTRSEFGVDPRVLWLPDVFGYSAALPQLMKQSGLDTFMTTKISWSQFNRFPHDTFRWRGLDGTEVLTHFVTTPDSGVTWGTGRVYYTYNGRLTPAEVKGIWEAYKQKDVNDELLLIYGWGDGGGGPTQEMLERARVMRNLPGLPRVRLDTAENYFARLHERVGNKPLPVWDGELYLEYHRGTYTSQARNKRANRKAEQALHNAEAASALAATLTATSYPQAELNRAWELVLVNQFHDILPGSSIHAVYEDSARDYAEVQRVAHSALDQATQAIAGHIPSSSADTLIYNPLSWPRDDLVVLPLTERAQQIVEENGEKRQLALAVNVPSLGYRLVTPEACTTPSPMTITPTLLENVFYRLTLNAQGQITSLLDKANGREVLAHGARANVFQVFEDKPLDFDAWDIDIYYQEKMEEMGDLVGAVVEEMGPLRGVLRLDWRWHDSLITQRIALYSHTRRIDFRTHVDWHAHQALLKVAFPVAVRATRATYEVQFGNVERPTHWNTSWDWARFEVSGHRWADLSEGNYGVALLNDCKYGHDIKDNVMRLTLIKSGIEPDPEADQGEHTFTYSLFPHSGDWRGGQVARVAYELNYPVVTVPVNANPSGDLAPTFEFARVNAENVIIETVKKAEDSEAWIVRVYEYEQCRSQAVEITFGRHVERAVECNLMEEDERPVAVRENAILFPIAPYEVKTFKVWLR